MSEVQRQAVAEVEEVYRELEELGLARNCVGRTRCCRFRLTGRTPMLTAGEALVAARGVRAAGRKTLPESGTAAAASEGTCPLLGQDGRCSIYLQRPFGCRTHFCEAAGGNYPRSVVRRLIHRLEEVAERLGDSDVRALESAVSRVLQER